MKSKFIDHHVSHHLTPQKSGEPRSFVRREFDHGVVWFFSPPFENSELDRVSDLSFAENLETEFANEFGVEEKKVLTPQNF
jgi:hypothetical protein